MICAQGSVITSTPEASSSSGISPTALARTVARNSSAAARSKVDGSLNGPSDPLSPVIVCIVSAGLLCAVGRGPLRCRSRGALALDCLDDRIAHLGQWILTHDGTAFERRPRHAVDQRRRFVLPERDRACLAQLE